MWWARMENMFKKYGGASEGASVPEQPCTGKHRNHMCAMAARADFQQVADSVKNPNFVCMNCGRVADVADNLCNPVAMSVFVTGSLNA